MTAFGLLGTQASEDMVFWNDSYSGYPAIYTWGAVGEVRLAATGSEAIKLNSFFLGAWPNTSRSIDIRVYDLSYNELIHQDAVAVPGSTGTTFHVNLTSAVGGGFIIQGSNDLYDGGFNLIDVELASSGVPEPGTIGLMSAGLAMLWVSRRRKK